MYTVYETIKRENRIETKQNTFNNLKLAQRYKKQLEKNFENSLDLSIIRYEILIEKQ